MKKYIFQIFPAKLFHSAQLMCVFALIYLTSICESLTTFTCLVYYVNVLYSDNYLGFANYS